MHRQIHIGCCQCRRCPGRWTAPRHSLPVLVRHLVLHGRGTSRSKLVFKRPVMSPAELSASSTFSVPTSQPARFQFGSGSALCDDSAGAAYRHFRIMNADPASAMNLPDTWYRSIRPRMSSLFTAIRSLLVTPSVPALLFLKQLQSCGSALPATGSCRTVMMNGPRSRSYWLPHLHKLFHSFVDSPGLYRDQTMYIGSIFQDSIWEEGQLEAVRAAIHRTETGFGCSLTLTNQHITQTAFCFP